MSSPSIQSIPTDVSPPLSVNATAGLPPRASSARVSHSSPCHQETASPGPPGSRPDRRQGRRHSWSQSVAGTATHRTPNGQLCTPPAKRRSSSPRLARRQGSRRCGRRARPSAAGFQIQIQIPKPRESFDRQTPNRRGSTRCLHRLARSAPRRCTLAGHHRRSSGHSSALQRREPRRRLRRCISASYDRCYRHCVAGHSRNLTGRRDGQTRLFVRERAGLEPCATASLWERARR